MRLLATSDLHGRVLSYDYANQCSVEGVGLEAAGRTIARLRQTGPPALLLDAGDFLFGGTLGDLAFDAEWFGPNPMIAAMNALGYDAVGLGNHELDYGLQPLSRALETAEFPVVCSNLEGLADPYREIRPPICSTQELLKLDVTDDDGCSHTLSIGIVSFLPFRQLRQVRTKYPQIGRLAIRDTLSAFDERVADLKAAGANLIVALCHDGMESGDPTRSGSPLDLARRDGVDAIVMGHQHGLFPSNAVSRDLPSMAGIDRATGRLAGIPAIMPGCWGRHVGAIDLTLKPVAGGGWKVEDSDVSLHSTAKEAEGRIGRALPAVALRAHDHARLRDGQVLGQIHRPATSYFARLGRCPGTMLLAGVMRDTVLDEMEDTRGLPVIGLAAPFQAGGAGGSENYADIPEGPLRIEHLTAMHPFPDRICAVEVTGAELRDWYERLAAGFHRISPESHGPLVDATLPSSDFHFGPDLEVTLELDAPALFSTDGTRIGRGTGRVTHIRHGGRPVRDDARLLIAVTEYRADGGGYFPGCIPENLRWRSAGTVRDAITARAGAAIGPDLWCPAFDLRIPRDSDPVFVTGAGARHHPAAMREAGVVPESGTPGADGWLRCRLEGAPVALATAGGDGYAPLREVGAGRHLANPVRSGRKQP